VIRLLNERNQVRAVAERWRDRLSALGGQWFSDTSEAIYERLVALPPETSTAAEIAAITGTGAWCEPRTCYACGLRSWDCLQFDMIFAPSCDTAIICAGCLRKALALVEQANGGG
jgi:hypothetical protein